MPKQFMLLYDKPIVFHTLEKLNSFDENYKIVLVINKENEGLFFSLSKEYNLRVPITIAYGGNERFFSVKNGLEKISELQRKTNKKALVAIHDGVRMFVNKQIFEKSFLLARENKNVVTAIQSTDSVRMMTEEINKSLNRKQIYLVQTPQTFAFEIIYKAYQQDYKEQFTDDASVVESIGEEITIVEGNRKNIKITYPLDLLIAETILKNEENDRKY